MISLARITLMREWRKFLPAVLAIAFSGLLMLIQLALLIGMFGTFATVITQSDADLWVGYPGTPCLDFSRDIDVKAEVFLRQHPQVVTVELLRWTPRDIRRADGSSIGGRVIGVDTRGRAMTLNRNISPEQRRLLEEPDTVLLDESTKDNVGVKIGEYLELNGRRARLVGFTKGLGTIGETYVICSLESARHFTSDSLDEDTSSYLLVKLRDSSKAEQVRDELQPSGSTRTFEVWTASEFSLKSQLYWILESGAGNGFAFSTFLALVVGIVITGQTMRGVIAGSIRELATLKALGVSKTSLRAIVLEQTFWIGMVGLLLTIGVTAAVKFAATQGNILMATPLWSYGAAVLFVAIILVFSSLSSVRTLSKVEPAVLLR